MPEAFDPYRKWLGIPPKDRPPNGLPPNHYRLLSLELFEEDGDAISNAADRQMAHVRTFQAGEHSALSQKLLNELSAARVCLLNRERKAEYDAVLRREFAAQEAAAAPKAFPPAAPLRAAQPLATPQATSQPIMPAAAVVPVDPHPFAPAAPFVTRTPSHAPRRRGGSWQIPAAVLATLGLLAGAVYVAINLGGGARVEDSTLGPGSRIVARPEPDQTKEHRRPHDDSPKKTIKTTPDASSDRPNKIPGSASTSSNVKPPRAGNDGPASKLKLAPLAPTKVSAPAVVSTPSHPLLPGQIDLLGRIDVDRDKVAGTWKRDAEGLVSPAGGAARLKIPYQVPDEYVVTVEVERLSGDEAFGVGLASGKWWTVAWLGGRALYPTGLHRLENSAKNTQAGRLPRGKRTSLAYCVRRTGVVLLQPAGGASVGWQGIIDWKGDFGTWTWPESWSAPEKGRLELISSDSSFRVLRCVLTPVKDWNPDDGNVARVAKGLSPLGGGAPTVNPRAPLGRLLTTPEKKVPVPSTDRLTAARRIAKDKFQQDLQAAKTPEQHLVIARKSQRAALDEKADSPERYALLDLARELAAGAGSTKVAFEAIDGLAKWFEIEEFELRLATLEAAGKAHSGSAGKAAKKEQFDSARDLIEASVAIDRFPEALRAAVLAQAAARILKDQDPGLAKQIAEERKEIDKLAKAFAAIKHDLERLKADANDTTANLAVGRFYCLAKRDWERGLPHLAAGDDTTLKDLAQRELARPSGADDEKSLGDAWWELSRKEKGPIKAVMAGRACFWYRRAVTFLSGVEKEAVEVKLEEVGETGQTDKTQFLSELPETKVEVENKWFAKGRNAVENKALKVGGKESPHGLFTHPKSNGIASVSYELGKKAKRLNLDVGIDDGANANPRTALLFQVWGDGVLLQPLGPIAVKGQVLGCELNVANVKVLELRVICAGRNNFAHAVWLEPRVTWK